MGFRNNKVGWGAAPSQRKWGVVTNTPAPPKSSFLLNAEPEQPNTSWHALPAFQEAPTFSYCSQKEGVVDIVQINAPNRRST